MGAKIVLCVNISFVQANFNTVNHIAKNHVDCKSNNDIYWGGVCKMCNRNVYFGETLVILNRPKLELNTFALEPILLAVSGHHANFGHLGKTKNLAIDDEWNLAN